MSRRLQFSNRLSSRCANDIPRQFSFMRSSRDQRSFSHSINLATPTHILVWSSIGESRRELFNTQPGVRNRTRPPPMKTFRRRRGEDAFLDAMRHRLARNLSFAPHRWQLQRRKQELILFRSHSARITDFGRAENFLRTSRFFHEPAESPILI